MAYQVIARKFRPQAFSEVIGQDHITQTLTNALQRDRLHHALLFTGPRGTGKTSSARILAKSLRCPNAKNFIPCDTCPTCQEIVAGRSLDVQEIDGASNNGVDAIRELRDSVGYMPSSGYYKLYIIDEVHMLSTSAFNALLKTLEEPPAHVIFVMATTEVQKIPNTILSRCQRFDFRLVASRTIVEHLRKICDQERVEATTEALWAIARQGEGSVRDSLSLLDQVITFCDENIDQGAVVQVLGLTDRSLLLAALKALVAGEVGAVMETLSRLEVGGHDPKLFLQNLLEELRHLLFARLAEQKAEGVNLDLPDAEIEELKELAAKVTSEDIHLLFDMALKGAQDIARATDPHLVLEMVLLRMSQAPRLIDLNQGSFAKGGASPKSSHQVAAGSSSSPTRLVKTENPIRESSPSKSPSTTSSSKGSLASDGTADPVTDNKGGKVAAAKTASRASLSGFDDSMSLEGNWKQLIHAARQQDPVLAAKIENLVALEIEGTTFVLGLPEKLRFLSSQFRSGQVLEKVEKIVQTNWQKAYKIDLKAVNGDGQNRPLSPKEAEQRDKETKRKDLERRIQENPLVQKTQKIFNAKIKAIKELQ